MEQQLSIIYIEDEFLIRINTVKMLIKNGFKVVEAKNGKEGLALYLQLGADLIITDLKMDVMDGFKLIHAIRDRCDNIPIIITTAYPESGRKIIGANALLEKPVFIDKLLETIKKAI